MRRIILFCGILILLCALFATADGILVRTNEKRGIELANNQPMLFFSLGKFYFEKGEFERASSLFSKAFGLNGDFKEALYNFGVVEYEIGNTDEAIEKISNAIELDRRYAKAYYSLGLIYFYQKDYDASIFNLQKAVEIENSANENFDIAIAYADRFRYGKGDVSDLKNAVNYYIKADEIQPGFPHALSNAEILGGIITDIG